MDETIIPDAQGNFKLPDRILERLKADPKLKMWWRKLSPTSFLLEFGYDPPEGEDVE